MTWEDALFQIALLVIPAGAVLMTTIYFLRKESEKQVVSLQLELKKQRHEFFLPNRTDAYQRAVLFLERIHPSSLIMRLHNPGLPAKAFQAELLKTIREEYEHNVAQQLFISLQGWEMLKNAKEETIKIINIAGGQMEPTSMSMDLAAKIFELVGEIGELPSEIATKNLKAELQQLF